MLFLVGFMIILTTFAQKPSKTIPVATLTTKIGYTMYPGDFIYNIATNRLYYLPKGAVATKTITSLGGDITAMTTATATYYVDTATAQNVHGVKTFYDAPQTSLGGSLTNTAFGGGLIFGNVSGTSNSSFGYQSLKAITSGNANSSFGTSALITNQTGSNNTALGSAALYLNTGSNNTAIGQSAMANTGSATNNTSVGYYSLWNNTTGQYNTAIGLRSGNGNKTGSSNKFLGYYAGHAGNTATTSNELFISNIAGGADTAIIYGVMNGTPATNTLQLNATTRVPALIAKPGDTTGKGIPANRGMIMYNTASSKFYGYNGTWNALW